MDDATNFDNEIAPVVEYVDLQGLCYGDYEPNGEGDLVHLQITTI